MREGARSCLNVFRGGKQLGEGFEISDQPGCIRLVIVLAAPAKALQSCDLNRQDS